MLQTSLSFLLADRKAFRIDLIRSTTHMDSFLKVANLRKGVGTMFPKKSHKRRIIYGTVFNHYTRCPA